MIQWRGGGPDTTGMGMKLRRTTPLPYASLRWVNLPGPCPYSRL